MSAPAEVVNITEEPKRGKGLAPIKQEFRKTKWFDENDDEDINTGAFGDDEVEGQKFDNGDSNSGGNRKNRGQNKKRKKLHVTDDIKLCPYIASGDGNRCTFGDKCKFTHDIEAYLKSKPADLGDRCVNFEIYGRCRAGYACRFLQAHFKDGNLVVDEERERNAPVTVKNGITPETMAALRKHTFNFEKSEAFLKDIQAEIDAEMAMKDENTQRRLAAMLAASTSTTTGSPTSTTAEAPSTPVAEKLKEVAEIEQMTADTQTSTSTITESISVQTSEQTQVISENNAGTTLSKEEQPLGPIFDINNKKKINFKDKTYLAPLTTVGNLPFRRICKEYGVDITCGEMAMATNLLQGQKTEWALTKRHASEDLFGIQICGYKTEQLVKACQVINETVEVDFVDLNMGCPIDMVFNKGGGSALLDSHGKMLKMLRGMQHVLDAPVTVKFRTGVKDNQPTAHKLVPKLESVGIRMGTLHGRSRQQRYTRLADWNYIKGIKSLTNDMALYGNGDILSWEQYNQQKEESGVDGIMIGRGALIKPWIFEEIKTQRHWDISSSERFDMLKKFCAYGLEHWGSDTMGVNSTRRFLCEWQSFLYRYIPVGLLEVLPQHMNERPPPYYGRDELETLMASPRASDWIKITDRILGPAPDDFKFIPKHKANSFEG
ncbi:hypothetical protein BGW37DRAFT_496852 [Umbelopsis sp. PMI_123]|nr:hypothetical protein BGW37DRAFT_496852 [Umbelopsis sp. PMI_123]